MLLFNVAVFEQLNCLGYIHTYSHSISGNVCIPTNFVDLAIDSPIYSQRSGKHLLMPVELFNATAEEKLCLPSSFLCHL